MVDVVGFELFDQGLESFGRRLRIGSGGLEDLEDLVLSIVSMGNVFLDMGFRSFVSWDMGSVGGVQDTRLESEEGLEREHIW